MIQSSRHQIPTRGKEDKSHCISEGKVEPLHEADCFSLKASLGSEGSPPTEKALFQTPLYEAFLSNELWAFASSKEVERSITYAYKCGI